MRRSEANLLKEVQSRQALLEKARAKAQKATRLRSELRCARRRIARLETAIQKHRDGVINHDTWDDERLWSVLDYPAAQPVVSGGHAVSD